MPATLRVTTVAGMVIATVVLVLLGAVYHGTSAPGLADRDLTATARAVWPDPGSLLELVDGLAAPIPALTVSLLLALTCLMVHHRRLALVAVSGPLAAGATTSIVKPLVQRTIHGDNLAFPSGHTAFATAVALVVGLLVVGATRLGRLLGALVLVGTAVVVGTVMALDQVVIGAHYPTDTVGGACTAVVVVGAAALGVDALAEALSRVASR